jgi:hypothetical protein
MSIFTRRVEVRTIVAIFEFGVLGEMYSPTSAVRSAMNPLIGASTLVSPTAFCARFDLSLRIS